MPKIPSAELLWYDKRGPGDFKLSQIVEKFLFFFVVLGSEGFVFVRTV